MKDYKHTQTYQETTHPLPKPRLPNQIQPPPIVLPPTTKMATANKLNKEDEATRIRNKDHASRRAEMWIKEANDRSIELSKLLATLSTLTISLSLPIVFSKDLFLSRPIKDLLTTSWTFGLISIVFGVLNLILDSRYFSKLARIDNKSEGIWSYQNKTLIAMNAEDQANRSEYSRSSSYIPLICQGVLAFLSLLLLISVGIKTLQSNKNHFFYQTTGARTPNNFRIYDRFR